MPEINLVDPTLINYSDSLVLSIQAGPGGFALCILSTGDNQVKAFRHYKFIGTILEEDMLHSIAEILHKDELLRLNFQSTRVIYSGRKSTLVPSAFIREKYLKRILEFNQPLDDLDEVHTNRLSSCDSHLVFAVPTYFAGLISDKLANASFYNQATPVLTYVLNHLDELDETVVFLNLNKEFFDMVVIQQRKLTLYNSFLYVNSTDLLYFILYACKQLKIVTDSTPFILTGEHAGDSELTRELNNYIPGIGSLEKLPPIPTGEKLRFPTRQCFFGLIHLHQCE